MTVCIKFDIEMYIKCDIFSEEWKPRGKGLLNFKAGFDIMCQYYT